MRKWILIVATIVAVLASGCSSKFWDEGLLGRAIEETWTVTIHLDYDGDGDIDTVLYHYTLYTNGDLDVREEVIYS